MSTHATVAIIEDEPDIRQVLRDILKDEGYQVVEAGTGRAGTMSDWGGALRTE